jgi:hypothetical protein
MYTKTTRIFELQQADTTPNVNTVVTIWSPTTAGQKCRFTLSVEGTDDADSTTGRAYTLTCNAVFDGMNVTLGSSATPNETATGMGSLTDFALVAAADLRFDATWR